MTFQPVVKPPRRAEHGDALGRPGATMDPTGPSSTEKPRQSEEMQHRSKAGGGSRRAVSGLTRRERIRRRPEFLRVQNRGRRTRGRHLTLFTLPNDLGVDRLGVIATRRLGGAVVRNRSKRIVRELFRRNKVSSRRDGMDVVVLPRPGFSEVSFAVLRSDYLTTIERDARGH